MKLNHLDLPVPDVAATAAFFQQYFGFHRHDNRGDGSMAILVGEGGFVLILNRLGEGDTGAYPKSFHVGFLLDSDDAVREVHASLSGGPPAEPPGPMSHSYGAFVFFCRAPGNILIEVSHRPQA